ncbi:hypothetical protein N9933_02800 [bacterium]|nr:hypothetical protein [bacterium]
MKRYLTLVLFGLVIHSFSLAQSVDWARANGNVFSVGSSAYNFNYLAVDTFGNSFIASTIGSGPFSHPPYWHYIAGDTLFGHGESDGYLLKYNIAGTYQWSITFGASRFDWVDDICVDFDGNCYVSGKFEDSIFLGTTLIATTPNPTSNQPFVMSLDPRSLSGNRSQTPQNVSVRTPVVC